MRILSKIICVFMYTYTESRFFLVGICCESCCLSKGRCSRILCNHTALSALFFLNLKHTLLSRKQLVGSSQSEIVKCMSSPILQAAIVIFNLFLTLSYQVNKVQASDSLIHFKGIKRYHHSNNFSHQRNLGAPLLCPQQGINGLSLYQRFTKT